MSRPADSAATGPRVELMDGAPFRVDSAPVEEIVETWRILDRWWTEAPVLRTYYDVRVVGGARRVLCLQEGSWSDVTEAKAHAR
jgi:hypothetical protein